MLKSDFDFKVTKFTNYHLNSLHSNDDDNDGDDDDDFPDRPKLNETTGHSRVRTTTEQTEDQQRDQVCLILCVI